MQVTFMYNVTRQLNLVIKDLQIFTKHLRYKNRGEVVFGREFERALAALLLMFAPLAPHFASELWAGFADAARFRDVEYQVDRPLVEQLWPQVDADFNLDLLIKAEAYLEKTVRRPHLQAAGASFPAAERKNDAEETASNENG
ncbi:hypothetical protein HPB51_022969 [Rhipicephalus microplus]|uniref:Methionyl/Valyl/Leucyl/Isoleucyl-tRNA synthetase anticodon-binding domain-containing protein n=1 Tax=Rhipicephalus microplus TaxID=6941 RepID=A0A9J6DCH9_RHIMP|nr:hypothetical protein HPB51_022969 [Rhipicephalus microplus]